MTTKTEKTYKECKLITYKNKDSSYTTYVFAKGNTKAVEKYNGTLKRNSIEMAQIAIDYNEYNKFRKA